jgi:hypothetical protein
MANKHRGEVALEADGKTFKIAFSINAMCELEDLLNRSIVEVMTELEGARENFARLRIKTVRAIVWASLRDHHPESTMEDAGDIVTAAGVPAVMAKIAEAIILAFPPQSAGSAEGKGKPKRGTGG